MFLTIKIDLDNAAFEDDSELPRVLRSLANEYEYQSEQHRKKRQTNLYDYNGNLVGVSELHHDPITHSWEDEL